VTVERARAFVLCFGFFLGSTGCVDRTSDVPEGVALFRRHCASCHGIAGRGDGPAAAGLAGTPADLTSLRRAGRFQEADLMATIDGRKQVAIHGSRDMPVWGRIFEQAHGDEPFPAYSGIGDTRALVDYLATLQED